MLHIYVMVGGRVFLCYTYTTAPEYSRLNYHSHLLGADLLLFIVRAELSVPVWCTKAPGPSIRAK